MITRGKMSYFNKERNEEEEEEEEEEIIQNEEPLQPIDSTFTTLVLNIKIALYNNIIMSPPLNTKEAQDNRLLVSYLNKLTSLRDLCLDIQYHALNEEKLNEIIKDQPTETRDMIKALVQWLIVFFNKNNIVDIIPVRDYIKNKLYYHSLVRN